MQHLNFPTKHILLIQNLYKHSQQFLVWHISNVLRIEYLLHPVFVTLHDTLYHDSIREKVSFLWSQFVQSHVTFFLNNQQLHTSQNV